MTIIHLRINRQNLQILRCREILKKKKSYHATILLQCVKMYDKFKNKSKKTDHGHFFFFFKWLLFILILNYIF